MKKIATSRIWSFGTACRYVQDIPKGRKIHGDNYILANLKRIQGYLAEFELAVTQKTVAARELKRLVEELEATDPNAVLSETQASNLRKQMAELRTTLLAELRTVQAYMLTPKRHSVEALTSDMRSIIGAGVFDALPDIAQFDLDQAGNCIAFELSTSAAFHLMRATEASLRIFYKKAIRTRRVPATMWGPIVAEMRKKPSALKTHKTLLDHLDNIRVNFRNPTQHPEAKYTLTEAENLLGLCVDVLSRMAATIAR